jgi:rhodanese-related sulfurtransferase
MYPLTIYLLGYKIIFVLVIPYFWDCGGQHDMKFMLFIIIVISLFIFRRYLPVIGLNDRKWTDLDINNIKVIDVRDYNDSYKNPIPGAINIPIAYLNRYYNEIPDSDLHVIACDSIGKNVGVRFLRKKGFNVIGYTIISDNKVPFMDKPIRRKAN